VIGGLLASALVRVADLVITDVLNEQPNSATLTANLTPHAADTAAFYPPAFDPDAFVTTALPMIYPSIRRGQPIEIYAGTLSPDARLFAGEIVIVEQVYELDRPELVAYHLSCTDYTRALNRRKVTKSYPTQSVTAIVLDLMASRAADGFTTTFVTPNLPSVAIDFTFEDMNRALTRLANRIGGYWYVDYTKALHFFLEEPGDTPAPLEPGGEPFDDFRIESDLTQVRTRVLVEGLGTTVLTQVGPGATVIPVRDPVMFPVTGGQAIVGQQRLTYTGVIPGGTGSLIGTGAQPTVALTVAGQTGAGIEVGTHAYAVTFQTAAGESLPSPAASVLLGQVEAPATGPTPGPPQAGNGPDPGVHRYAVTFVTASGETTGTESPPVTTLEAVSVGTPGATGAALRNQVGNLPTAIALRYATTFLTLDGESLPGAASAPITSQGPAPPPFEVDQEAWDVLGPYPTLTAGAPGLAPSALYTYWVSFLSGSWESALSSIPPGGYEVGTPAGTGVTADFFWGFRRSSDPRVTGRKIYRSVANGVQPRLLATLNYNDMAAAHDRRYVDTTADASLGPVRVGSGAIGTPPGNQATVTLPPPPSDPRVTGRAIYRSDAGAPFRRVVIIDSLAATEYLDSAATVAGQPDAPAVDTSGGGRRCVVPLTAIATGPLAVTARRLYRTAAAGAAYLRVATIADNTTTSYTDTTPDAGLGAAIPLANSTNAQQVAVSAIPIGGSGTIARRIYRSAANTTALKLLTAIADNATTTYTDAASDATLGAAVPVSDTSGLTQPAGQVNAGATVIPVAGPAAFAPTGGYAIVGNGEQVLRYTGISGNTLIGIPATGPGSLTATVAYNASITVAPALTGIPASGPWALVRGLIDGEEINLLIQRDDLAAQAALAGIEGGDGVIEHVIIDRRLSPAGATATADAELALFSTPELRVSYTTRDPRTRTGKVILVNLPAPTNVVGSFLIQKVQLSRFHIPNLPPLRTVQASSTRFSFDDVLRRLSFEVSA